MKKRISLVITLGVLGGLLTFAQAYAAQRDAFTFFIPYTADSLAEYFRAGGQQPGGFTVTGVENIISISVLRGDSLIYYDQWEDTLESNILLPIQTSTQVWGDGDPSNGSAPGIPSDILSAGDIITLQNIVGVPRNPADLFFDGGDKIVSAGGAIAVTLAAWPRPQAAILFAGAWELYSVSRWGETYVIPVGQDVARPMGGFNIVGLNVQAVEDGTSLQVVNGDGTTIASGVVLNEGEQFNVVSGVLAGASVVASAPVQVHIFTKDPASTWEARAYTMLPRDQWANDYLAPRSSDGDYWLYNPDSNALLVTVQTVAGPPVDITIQANGAGRYPLLPAPVIGSPSGVRFTAADGRPFYGVAALDADADQDWGYSLLPVRDMTTQALVGWAPGNWPPPSGPGNGGTGFESRVYVTAVDTTTITVDYNNDGNPDNSFPVSPLAEVDITDPDWDLTGARLYTDGVPFIAVWGQDQGASLALPSIDLGTNIVPLRAPSIQKGYTVVQEGYSCGTVAQDTILQFRLQAFNDSNVPIPNAVVRDTLPAGVMYVAGSTMMQGTPIPDNSSGSPFPLDEGGLNVGTIPELGVVRLTFDAVVGDVGFTNQAGFVSPSADPASVDVSLPFRPASYQVTKTLIDPPGGLADPGDVITFSLTITNTGNSAITTLPLRDEFDANILTFQSASLPPDTPIPGQLGWTDVTGAGDLPPATSLNVLLSFTVNNPIPSNEPGTINVALAEGVLSSDGINQAIRCGEAGVSFVTATPTPTLTPTPTATATRGKGNGDGKKTATPTPPRTGTPPTTVILTPTPAVLLLPETGVSDPGAVPLWPWVALPALGLLLGWSIYRHRDKRER